MRSFPRLTSRKSMNEKPVGERLRALARKAGRRSWRCPEETKLAAYVEAGLTAREKSRLEAHLSDCDFCLSPVAFLLRTQDMTAVDPVPDWLLLRARAMAVGGAAPG